MKKNIAMILIIAVCIAALSGCAEKKTFDVTENASVVTESSTKTDKTDKKRNISDEPESPIETDADQQNDKTYDWGAITFVFNEVTEDLGDVTVGGPTGLPSPEGKWVKLVFTIVEGEAPCGELLNQITDGGNIKIDDYSATTATIQGIKIQDSSDLFSGKTYAGVDSVISVFYDVDENYDISTAKVFVNENVTIAAEEDSEDTGNGGDVEEIGSVDGITVTSGTIGKPGEGKMAYTPSGDSGYFAVNGTLKAQTTIGIRVDPDGILNFDLELSLDSAMVIDAEIQVLKDGSLLASYSEKGLDIPSGDNVINACVDTKESAPCSGEYIVRFYINGCLVNETQASLD